MKPSSSLPDVMILCGGLGTRLRPVVSDRPKPMADVQGKPFLELLITHLVDQGVKRIILCAGYMGNMIEDYFSRHAFGVDIKVVIEPSPLDTAGAVKHALPFVRDDSFIVINGDSFCDYKLSALVQTHIQKKATASIYATYVNDATKFGTLELSEQGAFISAFKEKGYTGAGWVNAGAYMFGKELFKDLPVLTRVSLEQDVFPKIPREQLIAYLGEESFVDIGSPDDYHRFQQI